MSVGSLLYSCVAHRGVILADYSHGTQQTLTEVAKKILEQIPPQDSKMCYAFEKFLFHYIVSEGTVYLCIADEGFGKRIPFTFLDDIRGRFKTTYRERARTTIPHAMQADFGRILQKQMEYYSTDDNADHINQVKKELEDVKEILISNIDKIIERGQKIDVLLEQTENLSSTSAVFKKQAQVLKNTMYWRNIKLIVLVVVILLIITYVILAIVCGGLLLPKCVKPQEGHTPIPLPPVPPGQSPIPPSESPISPTAFQFFK